MLCSQCSEGLRLRNAARNRPVSSILRIAGSLLWVVLTVAAQTKPPVTDKQPVTDTYGATRVLDNYQWLENAADPKVKAWVAAQNQYSRQYLDPLPTRASLRREVAGLLNQVSATRTGLQYAGGHYFLCKFEASKQQRFLVTTESVDDLAGERVLVDPNVLDPAGHLSIDWFKPSLDGELVAVAMSEGGSEIDSLHIYNRRTGQPVDAVIPRVSFPTGGGSMAWLPGNQSFLYTRYPAPGERPEADLPFYQMVYEHRLGTPVSSDRYVVGKDFPRIAETVLTTDRTGRYIVMAVANGDGGEFAHYTRTADGSFHQITRWEDAVVAAVPAEDGSVYLLSRHGSPRGKILRLPPGGSSLSQAQLLIPESQTNIEQLALVTGQALYLVTIDGGPNQVEVFDLSGKPQPSVPIPPVSSASNLERGPGQSVFLTVESFVQPARLLRFDGHALSPTAVAVPANQGANQLQVERVFAISKDGTRIPMTIVRSRNGPADGTRGALLSGYGGYGISMTPSYLGYSPSLVWLNAGNVLAIANLRGGAEYGEAWHQAGKLTSKQNVFDDFYACGRYLVDHQYAAQGKLAAIGGSNGGLLMGATLTQHPDLFRAVVSFVGIYDMLRVERDSNGAFNVPEFGSVKDPDQFKALYAYSPYHHVDSGVRYPAVFFLTGDNDGRVNPAHSRKMTARLQEATASPHPILLRTTANAGHGFGTSKNEQIDQQVDVYAFLFDQLGLSSAHVDRR